MSKLVGQLVVIVALLLVTTGCFEIEQLIRIDQDRSGTSRIEIRIDMENTLGPLAALAGEEFDLEAEMKNVMESQGSEMDAKFAELEAKLPAGVVLQEVRQRAEGSKMVVAVDLAFDDLDALVALMKGDAMSGLANQGADSGAPLGPASGLTVTEDGGEIRFRFADLGGADDGEAPSTPNADPASDMEAQMAAMFESMFKDMRYQLVLETPWDVVDSNAMSEQGNRLQWSYDLLEVSKLKEQGKAPAGPFAAFVVDTARVAQEQAERAARPSPTALAGKAVMDFAYVGGGAIAIDGKRTRVAPFDMAVSEVTQRQYKAVMRAKPSQCANGCGKELPVQSVSWFQAVAFANALSEREGLEACYVVEGSQVSNATGTSCAGYRLPTEAEFELALRAGGSSTFPWGEAAAEGDAYAWHSGNGDGRAHAVMSKEANALGLFDLSGNVSEWVFGTLNGADHVARGGSFADGTSTMRSDARRGYPGAIGHAHIGFRVVRSRP